VYCLDTNIVIFAMNRRRPHIARRLTVELQAGTPLLVPAIVRFELDYGLAKSHAPEQSRFLLESFLAVGFLHPAFDSDDAREAAAIRAGLEAQGIGIGPFDYLIAAQARRRGAIMVTLNRREFDRVPRLAVTDWTG